MRGIPTDDQKLTMNPIGSWVRSMKKMAYMPKDADISKAVDETGGLLLEGDSVAYVKTELLCGYEK